MDQMGFPEDDSSAWYLWKWDRTPLRQMIAVHDGIGRRSRIGTSSPMAHAPKLMLHADACSIAGSHTGCPVRVGARVGSNSGPSGHRILGDAMTIRRYSVNQYPVQTLLTWNESGEITSSEIQRLFVWNAAKMAISSTRSISAIRSGISSHSVILLSG